MLGAKPLGEAKLRLTASAQASLAREPRAMWVIGKASRRDSAPTPCNPEGRRSLAPGGVARRFRCAASLRASRRSEAWRQRKLRLRESRAPTLAPKIAVAAHACVRNPGSSIE